MILLEKVQHPGCLPEILMYQNPASGLVVLVGITPAQFPAAFEQHIDPVFVGVVYIEEIHELILDVTAEGLLFHVPFNITDAPGALIGKLNVQTMKRDER